MATLAVAAAGAAIGGAAASAAGWAITTGIALGWSIGAFAGNQMFGGPEGQDVEGPRLEDLSVQTSTYGAPIPIMYGSMRVAGNIIWSAGLTEHKHEEEVGGGGGKGGGSSSTRTSYTYTCSFAVGICEGEIAGINRIWMDGKLFQDQNQNSFQTAILQEPKVMSISVYTGTENQEPDPVIEAEEGEGNVPGYRGLAYIVFEDLELGDYANRIPNIEVEVADGLGQSTQPLTVFLPIEYFSGDDTFLYQSNMFFVLVLDRLKAFDLDFNLCWELSEGYLSGLEIGYNTLASGRYDDTIFAGWGVTTVYDDNYHYIDEYDIKTGKVVDSWVNTLYFAYMAYGYVDGIGTVFAFLNTSTVCFYHWKNQILIKEWSSLVDHNGELIHGGPMYIYDGNLILKNYHGYMHIYSDNSVPYPKRTISTKQFDVYGVPGVINGNLVTLRHATDGGRFHFYRGLSDVPFVNTTFSYDDDSTGTQHLVEIVGDVIEKTGISSSEYDVTDIFGQLTGFAVTKPMSAKEALKPLILAYQFNIVEAEGKIKCIPKGQSLVRSFTENELGAHEQGSDIPTSMMITRSQKNNLPTKITVVYKDQNSDYQIASQYAKRVTQDFNNHEQIELPLVITATQALQTAEILLAVAWAGRSNYSIQVLSENIDLLPGCTIDAAGHRMRIEEMSLKLPSIIEIQGISEGL